MSSFRKDILLKERAAAHKRLLLILLMLGQHILMALAPEDTLDDAGDRPADGIAEIDDRQGTEHGEYHEDPQQTGAADTDDLGDGGQQREAQTAHGADKDIQYAIEKQRQTDIGQTDHTDRNDLGIGGIETKETIAETPDHKGDAKGTGDGQHHGQLDDLLNAAILSCTDVLAGEGHAGLNKGIQTDIDKALDVGRRTVAGNNSRRVEGIDARLDNNIAKRENNALKSGRNAYLDDV